MAALNLFPSRVPFVDSEGKLTPEAYRALRILYDRVGGAYGDQGEDTFSDISGESTSDNKMISIEAICAREEIRYVSPMDMQHSEHGYHAEMIMQGES